MAELCAAKGYTVLFQTYLERFTVVSLIVKDVDLEKATKLIRNYNIDKGYEDIVSCLQWLKKLPM